MKRSGSGSRSGSSPSPSGSSRRRLRRIAPVLRRYLEGFDAAVRVPHDAVLFPRRYDDPADREVVGLLAALFAFGRVASFASFLEILLGRLGPSPDRTLRTLAPGKLHRRIQGLRYRWAGEQEILRLLLGIRSCLARRGTLRAAFAAPGSTGSPDYLPELTGFVEELSDVGRSSRYLDPRPGKSFRKLLTHPARGSACKRLNLYLRWMVRPDDGVDLGVWTDLETSRLTVPLDTHVLRVSRHLGLTTGNGARWKTAREITEALRLIEPDDPTRLDFALCHLGMSGGCPPLVDPANCGVCPVRKACRTFSGYPPSGRSSPR